MCAHPRLAAHALCVDPQQFETKHIIIIIIIIIITISIIIIIVMYLLTYIYINIYIYILYIIYMNSNIVQTLLSRYRQRTRLSKLGGANLPSVSRLGNCSRRTLT